MCASAHTHTHTHGDFTTHQKWQKKYHLYILSTLGGLFIHKKPRNHWVYAMMVIVKYANSRFDLTSDNKINI